MTLRARAFRVVKTGPTLALQRGQKVGKLCQTCTKLFLLNLTEAITAIITDSLHTHLEFSVHVLFKFVYTCIYHLKASHMPQCVQFIYMYMYSLVQNENYIIICCYFSGAYVVDQVQYLPAGQMPIATLRPFFCSFCHHFHEIRPDLMM